MLYRKMRRNPKKAVNLATKRSSGLPSHFTALRFACGCFGVNMPELQKMLNLMRRREKKPNHSFPRRLNRVMLNEAEDGKGDWCGALTNVAYEALYDRIRRQNGKPLFGSAGNVTERLAFTLLRLYEKILPELKTDSVSSLDALWLLVTEVFLPTAFLELALNWQSGLGTEFQVQGCWYLPVFRKGERLGPVRCVLQHWLRAAGFRNAHDLKKEMGSDSARRSADRWLSGQFVPTIDVLHRLVDRFSKRVEWLDQRDAWKTRFTLACGMEHLYAAMDHFFQPRRRDCSLKIRQMLKRISKDWVVVDDGRILADSYTFFAARLLQRRIKLEGRWESEVAGFVPRQSGKTFAPSASEEEIDQYRRDVERRMNPGNWFLRFIERESTCGKQQVSASLQERILNLGVRELNRILDSKRGRRVTTRQP